MMLNSGRESFHVRSSPPVTPSEGASIPGTSGGVGVFDISVSTALEVPQPMVFGCKQDARVRVRGWTFPINKYTVTRLTPVASSIKSCTRALVGRAPSGRLVGYDTAVVNVCGDAIAARNRTCNPRDTVVHETRWDGNGARKESRKASVWSATPAPTAS